MYQYINLRILRTSGLSYIFMGREKLCTSNATRDNTFNLNITFMCIILNFTENFESLALCVACCG